MTPAELRRLLELAAKAAGKDDYVYSEQGYGMVPYNGCGYAWNPADDDGDSRRLEVHFGFIVNAPSAIGTHAIVKFYDIEVSEPVTDRSDAGRAAATRLAVLRAAAAIGEAMP